MKKVIIITVLFITTLLGFGVFKLFQTNWFEHAGFVSVAFVTLGIMLAIALLFQFCKHYIFVVTGLMLVTASCQHAKSNQQVVVSTDCGVTWEKISAGESVPKGVGNYCFMKVIIPNYPMQGAANFITNLKGRVRASVEIDYDYTITDPLLFIKQAKYLGKANSDGDEPDDSAFEGAENMVIDKRIKDISKEMFILEDIVEIDQSKLEDELHEKANEVLGKLGVQLNFITLTFDLDEQTRQAIDISTAMKIYESRGIQDIAKDIMVARAGATKVSVTNIPAPTAAVAE